MSPTTSQHHARLNVSGWVAPLLGRYGMIGTEQGNRKGFLDVLRDLYRRLRQRQIALYADGAGWHKGLPVREFLHAHPRLHQECLPPYQPALNMQERIWPRIRYEATTNCWFASLNDTWHTVQRTTGAWTPRKLQRFCNVTWHV